MEGPVIIGVLRATITFPLLASDNRCSATSSLIIYRQRRSSFFAGWIYTPLPHEDRKYKPHRSEERSCMVIADDHSGLRHRDVVILFDGQCLTGH